jgi:RNA polymerase sigma-70 factor, ECF subfamily
VSVGAPPAAREFDSFFRIEYPKLVALGAAMTGSHESGRDLAQEALLRSYRDWNRLAGLEVPGAWVRRVLINLAIDARRTSRSHERQLVPPPAETVTFDDPDVNGWWTAVRALPDRQRAVVVLHYLEDRSVADVASVLGIAEGTVKATLAHARRSLARTLSREE